MSGSKTWPARRLLEAALSVLDGGGTALALRLEHRISYDIDIFLEPSAVLRAVWPNRNAAARALTSHWQEPGHYVKLECEEGPSTSSSRHGRPTSRPGAMTSRTARSWSRPPAEILAKKLRYRGSQLVPRDVLDLLVAARFDSDAVATVGQAAPRAVRLAIDRIERISRRYRDTIADEVNPTTKGAEHIETDPLHVAAVLRGYLARMDAGEGG